MPQHRKIRHRPPTSTPLLLALAAAGAIRVASAAEAAVPAPAPADLSFEQLGAMEVTGVSKSVERLLDAPAAVTIIGSDEIRAFGFRTLGEVLAVAPGYYAFSDRAYENAGVRGFAPIGGSNSRVLLLIDGLPMSSAFQEQAMLGNESAVDLDLIDRIEVIRGPGSSVYGADAFLGVINVILKNPAQASSGARAWLGSGTERGATGTLSGSGSEDLHYLLEVTTSAAGGLDVVLDPQPGMPAGARYSGVDAMDLTRAFAKILSGNLRVNLGFNERRQGAGYGLHGDVPGDPRSWLSDGDTFADLHYEGTTGKDTDYVLRASAVQARYDAQIVDDPQAPNAISSTESWIDTEATVTHRFTAQNRLVFGAELRRDLRKTLRQANPLLGVFQDLATTENRYGLYAQSDIDWSDQWASSVGMRGDSNNGAARVDPRLALLWKPAPDQVLKLMAASAFRQPSIFEQYFAQPQTFLANPRLTPERVRTLDLGYEGAINADSRASLTLFHYRAIDLINQVLLDAAQGVTQFQNLSTANAQGVDASLDARLPAAVRLQLSLTYVRAADENGRGLQNSPHWSGRLGLRKDFAADWTLAGDIVGEGQRWAFDNSSIPGFAVANATVSRAPRRGRMGWTFGVYNLLGQIVAQPLAGLPRVDEPGRTWRASASYVF